ELVGPTGVIEEVRRGERNVDVPRLPDRLAAIERLEHCELTRPLLQQAGDPEEVLRALVRAKRRPAVRERLARGLHRTVDVGFAGLRDLGERLFARRVDGRVPLAGPGLDELAADEEAVALLE